MKVMAVMATAIAATRDTAASKTFCGVSMLLIAMIATVYPDSIAP
jgi:hypothetical protein